MLRPKPYSLPPYPFVAVSPLLSHRPETTRREEFKLYDVRVSIR